MVTSNASTPSACLLAISFLTVAVTISELRMHDFVLLFINIKNRGRELRTPAAGRETPPASNVILPPNASWCPSASSRLATALILSPQDGSTELHC